MTDAMVWTGDLDDDIVWAGDLNDACHTEWRGMVASVERLHDNAWFCDVTWDGDVEFHSAEAGMIPKSGDAARRLCEFVMMSVWADEQAKARREREAKRGEFLDGLNGDFDRLASDPEAWDDHQREMKEIGL